VKNQETGDQGSKKTGLEERMNLKKPLFALGFAALVALALPLRAQSGCVDSPEDPTILLALVSGAGALAASLWRFSRK
jgi:XrtJ-associated TM-motif-TM protein